MVGFQVGASSSCSEWSQKFGSLAVPVGVLTQVRGASGACPPDTVKRKEASGVKAGLQWNKQTDWFKVSTHTLNMRREEQKETF
jgi:hypothetical protein